MITPKTIMDKLDELYPSRNANILNNGRISAVEILETAMAQGFMDCLKFLTENESKKLEQNKQKQIEK